MPACLSIFGADRSSLLWLWEALLWWREGSNRVLHSILRLHSQLPMNKTPAVHSAIASLLLPPNPHCSDSGQGARQVWYIVPRAAAAAFEAAVARTLGGDARRALASLAAKHVMPALSPAELRELGVLRVVQPPGYAVVTLPVRLIWRCAVLPD